MFNLKNRSLSILLMTSLSLSMCMPVVAMQTEQNKTEVVDIEAAKPTINTLILDLGGIFLDRSLVSNIRVAGVWNMLSYLFKSVNVPGNIMKMTKLENRLFDVLNKYPVVKDPTIEPTRKKSGKEMPYILAMQQAGKYTVDELKVMTDKVFADLGAAKYFESKQEETLIRQIIDHIFDPIFDSEQNITLTDGIKLLKELGEQRNADGSKKYKIIALSNWAPPSFLLVKERFKKELAPFDDIITSGEAGIVKPNKGAYDYVVTKHHLDPKRCLFLDDQQENIDGAQRAGIGYQLLFKNTYDARQKLHKLGILPNAPSWWTPKKIVALTIAALGSAWLIWKYKR